MSFMTGIIPLLIVLLTFTYSLIAIIGKRVNKAIRASAKHLVLRYTVMPILSVLLLTNPMAYTFGKFVEEEENRHFMML